MQMLASLWYILSIQNLDETHQALLCLRTYPRQQIHQDWLLLCPLYRWLYLLAYVDMIFFLGNSKTTFYFWEATCFWRLSSITSLSTTILLLYVTLKFAVICIGIGNRFPPTTRGYLMAIIYGVGFFFSVIDFTRQSLSVNGLSYLNVTNLIRRS